MWIKVKLSDLEMIRLKPPTGNYNWCARLKCLSETGSGVTKEDALSDLLMNVINFYERELS